MSKFGPIEPSTFPPSRAGLSESLEAYAARARVPVHEARWYWRYGGLECLNVLEEGADLVGRDGPRVAPGVAVPVYFYGRPLRPLDVIEVENPHVEAYCEVGSYCTRPGCSAVDPSPFEECPVNDAGYRS